MTSGTGWIGDLSGSCQGCGSGAVRWVALHHGGQGVGVAGYCGRCLPPGELYPVSDKISWLSRDEARVFLVMNS